MRAESVALAGALLTALGGCVRPSAPVEPTQRQHGLIYAFPGVEGGERHLRKAFRGLRAGGMVGELRVHDWERPLGLLFNLIAHDRNRRDAAAVADEIATFRQGHPDEPIDLVGYSGGGGVAVMVLEALPTGLLVRNVVLVQPALSPDYDLTLALTHVEGRLVNFYSPYDVFILGAGTRIFGTMDRKYTASAGLTSFNVDQAVPRAEQREHFEQVRWTKDMRQAHHWGGHHSMVRFEWNRQYVAPRLVQPARSEGLRTAE